jgi:hypothetical protein
MNVQYSSCQFLTTTGGSLFLTGTDSGDMIGRIDDRATGRLWRSLLPRLPRSMGQWEKRLSRCFVSPIGEFDTAIRSPARIRRELRLISKLQTAQNPPLSPASKVWKAVKMTYFDEQWYAFEGAGSVADDVRSPSRSRLARLLPAAMLDNLRTTKRQSFGCTLLIAEHLHWEHG